MHVSYFCYYPMNLVTMTTKLPTGRGLMYCLHFSISLLIYILRKSQRSIVVSALDFGGPGFDPWTGCPLARNYFYYHHALQGYIVTLLWFRPSVCASVRVSHFDLVNRKETKPLSVFSLNFIHILPMMRG